MEAVNDIMDAIRKEGPEWFEGFKEIAKAAKGCTHDQIMKTIEFLEARKAQEKRKK